MYASGFSGGCRMAFVTSKGHKLAGVIACGAGGEPKSSQVIYGLCGTKCFNRHDMACSFKKIKNKDSILRFFPGNHNWANTELIEDAITHLNGVFLIKNSKSHSEQLAHYESSLTELIQSSKEKDPMRAFMWTSFAAEQELDGSNKKLIESIHSELAKVPENELYVKGLRALHDFTVKKFGTSPMAYKSLDPKVAKACLNEAPKYAGTPWGKILKELAEACKQP